MFLLEVEKVNNMRMPAFQRGSSKHFACLKNCLFYLRRLVKTKEVRAVVPFLLAGCFSHPDIRTPTEK